MMMLEFIILIATAGVTGLGAFLWWKINGAVQKEDCEKMMKCNDEKLDKLFERTSRFQVDLAETKTNVVWIKEFLEKNGRPH